MLQTALSFALAFLCSFAQANSDARLKTIIVNVPTNFGELRTEIHFAEKDLIVARRAEEIIKTDLTKVVGYFQYIPEETVHFNIDPYLRLTNGNAGIFPTNTINLYNFPASNLEHLISLEDWLQGLILHEFIHILHLDQTRGYLKFGRSIFGSIAKIPASLVPRWFTEGIAVWGESQFSKGGRLKNETLNIDLWKMFKKNKYCSTIDCLDAPGDYPKGQLSYWAGGHFLNYLETKKAGTIRCLIFENSKRVPFFLNGAFEECAGKDAADLFKEFRTDYLGKYNRPLDENIFGATDSQKGSAQFDGIVLKVETNKKYSALVRYDQDVNSYRILKDPIDHLGDIVQLDSETNGVLVAFKDDPQFLVQNKTWKIINIDTLMEEKTLKFSHDPSYVLPFGPDEYLTFSYEENHWRAYKIENNTETLIREWPFRYNLVSAVKNLEQVILKFNTANNDTATYVTDKNLIQILKNGVPAHFNEIDNKNVEGIKKYPRPEHFRPHYWFLATGNNANPGSIGATTSISDPMDVHSLSGTALIYPSVNRFGGVAEYVHTDHLWKQYFLFSRDYSSNSWSNALNVTSEGIIGTSYKFALKKWMYIPQFNLTASSTHDAISSAQTRAWSVINFLNYQALSQNDFWQTFLFSIEGGVTSPKEGNDYFKFQSKLNVSTNIYADYSIHLKSAYGKLFKSTLQNGVLYGGGLDQLQLVRRYEFYGLPYGDAYGNEILTSRITNDLNIWNIYRGRNFWPLFFKEAHLILGFESLVADRIFIDHAFYRNEQIYSWFFGTKLLTNLVYFVPTNINIIYASTQTPSGNNVKSFNFYLNLEI